MSTAEQVMIGDVPIGEMNERERMARMDRLADTHMEATRRDMLVESLERAAGRLRGVSEDELEQRRAEMARRVVARYVGFVARWA